MEHLPRSIDQLVDEQARRWQLARTGRSPAPRRPVVTVSRQHGAGGSALAQRLAQDLHLDFFDREILQQIAERADLNARVVSAVDEKDRDVLSDWLAPFVSDAYLTASAYHQHLTRVVATIAYHGGAVLLGRGAHLILGPGRALRVLVVAPLAARIAEVARRDGLSERAARSRIAEVEAERQAFLVKHFHADPADLSAFDLVVNTGVLGMDGAAGAVHAAFEKLVPREAALAHV